jgi:hypothetical protein
MGWNGWRRKSKVEKTVKGVVLSDFPQSPTTTPMQNMFKTSQQRGRPSCGVSLRRKGRSCCSIRREGMTWPLVMATVWIRESRADDS